MQSMRLDETLEHINVPSYVIDTAGVIRWLNAAARNMVGDVRGRQFTSVVAPEETLRARELFARKVVGAVKVTDAPVVVLDPGGDRISVVASVLPLTAANHAVGHCGQVAELVEDPRKHPDLQLTPPQAEVLGLLARGRTPPQSAKELPLSVEPVRNPARGILRATGTHSRLE